MQVGSDHQLLLSSTNERTVLISCWVGFDDNADLASPFRDKSIQAKLEPERLKDELGSGINLQCFFLKQERCEIGEVSSPNHPRMCAWCFNPGVFDLFRLEP